MKKKLIVLLVIITLITSTVPAMAGAIIKDTNDADIIADALLVRPFGVASIVVGSIVFVVALPFSIPTNSVGKVGQLMVVDPCKFTFVRPMGDFN